MKRLADCCLIEPNEGEWRIEGNRRYRVPIGSRTGARRIAQTVSRFGAGLSLGWVNPESEEVHYVVSGEGECYIDGFSFPLEPGTGVFVPKGAEFAVENRSASELTLVSVTCPEETGRKLSEPARTVPLTSYQAPLRVVHEKERQETPSGERAYRILVDQELGCQQVTQFVASIPRSKVPLHSHPYEGAIYVLEGEGTLWVGDQQARFGPGTSIYLPPGASHGVENRSSHRARLLGVIHPPGSPADRQ
jgi:mannose-6-phosphate isomerase-like protein (cupin superfamily)